MKFPWNKTSKPATAPTADTSAEQQNEPQLDAATTENAEAGKPATPKRNSKDIVAELNRAGEAGELVLSTDNLVKKYRQRVVANHVSINVRQGEIVGLLGPNGAGKTTTFYMTTGLVTPNEGRVFLNDVEITKLPVYKRAKLGIGYLPQEASVFRTLTVEDNLRLVLEMTNTTPEYQRDKLESLLDEFHLQKVRKNLGNRLSGGERRRCEIARCLAI
ncbi:MAG: ATP-binding cassette domain-containing protein, partial [Sodaliphilus sp.]|nr:ATP-binding cassette domain-containing protein [Sodaliphilus sp.]